MFCKKCGAQNVDGAKFCKQCGEKLEVVSAAEQVKPLPVNETLPASPVVNPAGESQVPPKSSFKLKSDNINEGQYVSSAFSAGWADISNSKGWFSKGLLLALCSIVPVLHWVVEGFSARWGREICLGVNRRCRNPFSKRAPLCAAQKFGS